MTTENQNIEGFKPGVVPQRALNNNQFVIISFYFNLKLQKSRQL